MSRTSTATNVRLVIQDTKLESYEVITFVEALHRKGFVHKPGNLEGKWEESSALNITNTGAYYLLGEGGSIRVYRNEVFSALWKSLKMIAALINALAVIWLSYLAVRIQIEEAHNSRNDQKIEQVMQALELIGEQAYKSEVE